MVDTVRTPEDLQVRHPLEPLAADEIAAAATIARDSGQLGSDLRFAMITLHEPAKDALDGSLDRVDRQAWVVAVDRATGVTADAVVSLTHATVVECTRRPGEQAPILNEEAAVAMGLVKADPRWQNAMRRRGVTDLDLVQLDPWPTGSFDLDIERGRRVIRLLSFARHHGTDNGYAHPVEGVLAFVDTINEEVLEVTDHDLAPVPAEPGPYDAASVGSLRTDLRPISITQPEGPSFTVDGHEIRWQRWRLRVSMHPIEGLVLHTVGYEDGGRVRPILHRASLCEMVVPYGDTSPMHAWKNAFDAGEYGLGRAVNSLTLGCDCVGLIHYFDAVMAGDRGDPVTVPNAICLHEEDYGILWKHVDWQSGTTEVRRSRRLVVSSIHTLANYEYGIFWYLYLDGTIQLELKLTGVVSPMAIAPGDQPRYAERVAPHVAAPHHQHLFSFRLDFDVDGRTNSVYEVETEPVAPGPDNPYGNAFATRSTLLDSERGAQRLCDPARDRVWKVINPAVRNALGQPVGYKLVPGATPTLLASPDSSVARRAAFATKNLWVTPFSPNERRAAGDYPNQHPGGAGLPEWTAADRSLENTDVVLWYTFGLTHIARPEDWPVMPVEYGGFTLKPVGFFDRNPALDVPPSTNGHCHSE